MLTTQQLATLRPFVLAEPSLAEAINSGQDNVIAAWLNADATPSYYVWRTSTAADDLLNSIVWASLTPTDTPDGTATFTNRALACQAKQLNLQIILQGRDSVASGKLNVRQGLSDALMNVPSGTGGALLDAGWAGAGKVKAQITRPATRAEKALAGGNGTTATPSNLTFEGEVSIDEAGLLR
jgi:hypothetical protein